MKLKTITVFGSARPVPGSEAYRQARMLGQQLAQAGFDVVNGGYGGTMQAVSQGATEAGGAAIGVTCALFEDRQRSGNAYLSQTVYTPDLLARLRKLTDLGDGFVVLDGGVGTLLELFLVWNLLTLDVFDKPCVLVGDHWRRALQGLERETRLGIEHINMLNIVDTVQQAVTLLNRIKTKEFEKWQT